MAKTEFIHMLMQEGYPDPAEAQLEWGSLGHHSCPLEVHKSCIQGYMGKRAPSIWQVESRLMMYSERHI